LTGEVYDAWSRILVRVPEARLALGNRALGSTENRRHVAEQFQRRSVDRERIEFLSPGPHTEFLRHYDRIDLALDAFPYNGGTTTSEAIWQGVPVIALDGDRWASRTSKSLLVAGGLSEWVAGSVEEYVERAVYWSSQRERLAEMRPRMRQRLRNSPVCDVRGLANHWEQVLELALEPMRTETGK
jgi:predicted O-linked N-acetylglucosamine transferase (SPINDLY family)